MTTDFTLKDRANSVAIQADGKVVIGGYVSANGDVSNADSLLARYNADGTLDTTFGQGGKVVVARPGQDQIMGLALQPDGKILAAGAMPNATNKSYYLARYNPDGSPDLTFSDGGVVTTPFSINLISGAEHIGLSVQADGSIVFARNNYNGVDLDLAVARFGATGVPDPSFGGTGYVTANLGGNERCNAVSVQADGKLIVVGSRFIPGVSNSQDSFVARFQGDGQLDPGFGSGGVVLRSFSSGSSDTFNDVALQADGKIVAVGAATPSNQTSGSKILIARFLGDPAPLLASAAAPAPVHQSLTATQARPALTQALAYWRALGEDTSRLGHLDLAIADLGGDRLGEASGSTITLDDNAAGWGWDVGRTAGRGRKSPSGRMDLLSALTHEVGHLLGRDHAEGGVMSETLSPGARRPSAGSPPPAVPSRIASRTIQATQRLAPITPSPAQDEATINDGPSHPVLRSLRSRLAASRRRS